MAMASKIVALMIGVLYVVFAIAQEGRLSTPVGKLVVAVLFPLALIWFPTEVGSVTGYVGRGGRIDTETPPFLVSFVGWLLLLGIPVLVYWSA
jgi:hypothetical protein